MRYCSDPRHSREPTAEEFQEDYAKRERAIANAIEAGIVTEKQIEIAREVLNTFKGYKRCTLPETQRSMNYYIVKNANHKGPFVSAIVYEESPEEAIRLASNTHRIRDMLFSDTELSAELVKFNDAAGVYYIVAMEGWTA